jgi:hypothetical protein
MQGVREQQIAAIAEENELSFLLYCFMVAIENF